MVPARSCASTDSPSVRIRASSAVISASDASGMWTKSSDWMRKTAVAAVANTNLKALRLLTREGSATLDRFIAAVDTMTGSTDDVVAVRALAATATSVARIQSLLFVHIPEASDTEMTALEARMRALGETVDAQLKSGTTALPASSAKADAAQAWADYQRMSAEVIRLSRLNTNVISFDVSTHEKRTATQACLDALAGLRDSIQGGPHATR